MTHAQVKAMLATWSQLRYAAGSLEENAIEDELLTPLYESIERLSKLLAQAWAKEFGAKVEVLPGDGLVSIRVRPETRQAVAAKFGAYVGASSVGISPQGVIFAYL